MVDHLGAWVQRRVGGVIRSRVAGADGQERAREIWATEGERWFTEDDPIWKVHADAAMFSGGIAALLLQSLHPLAMAGVAGHSGYRGDPWGRLQRTGEYLAVTTFGTVAQAEAAIAGVRRIHERVVGVDFAGRAYAASDPELLRWVHLGQVHSFLAAYQAYAAEPLSSAEADLYVEQAQVAATRLGATDLPHTVAEVEEQLAAYRPQLEVTPAARQAATFLLLNPPVTLPERPGYAVLATGAVGLLPIWARVALRAPLLFPTPMVARGVGRAGAGVVRWVMTGLERQGAAARGLG